ncbi:MAG: EamA family transporter [Bacillota bacterium]
MTLSPTLKGFIFVLAAAILWALSATTAKFLFNDQVSPWDLTQMRLVLSALFLGIYLAWHEPRSLWVERSDLGYMMAFAILGVSAMQFTYFYTISQTNVATAVFLEYLAPAIILVYELLQGRETPAWNRILPVIIAILGGFLIVKGTPGQGMAVTPAGLVTGIGSAFAFAFYILYSRYGLAKYSAWTLLFWGYTIGGLAWTLNGWPWETFLTYQGSTWLYFFYIAIFATILPAGFFFKGLTMLSPVAAGVTSTLEPVAAGILAFLLLGEVLTGMQLMGSLLILIAITVIQMKG